MSCWKNLNTWRFCYRRPSEGQLNCSGARLALPFRYLVVHFCDRVAGRFFEKARNEGMHKCRKTRHEKFDRKTQRKREMLPIAFIDGPRMFQKYSID